MQNNTHIIVTCFRSTINIATVSYRNCYHLYYRMLYLKSYIWCHFILTHNDILFIYVLYLSVLYLCFSRKYWIFGILNSFCHNFLKQSKKSITFDNDQQHNLQNTKFLLPPHSDHWNTEHYRGSYNCGEVDIDSYINRLASGNLRKSTTVTSQCDKLPCTWTRSLLCLYRWSHC